MVMNVEKLKQQLSEVVDPLEYDRLLAELAEAEKQATIEAARQRKQEAALAEEAKQSKIARRMDLVLALKELDKRATENDDLIFSSLVTFYESCQAVARFYAEREIMVSEINTLAVQLGLNTKTEQEKYSLLGCASMQEVIDRFLNHIRLLAERNAEAGSDLKPVKGLLKHESFTFTGDNKIVDFKGRPIV